MAAIIVAMLVILGLAVGTGALVFVGIEGRGRGRAPRLADQLRRAARHLNGDAAPPRRFTRLFS